jgi:predicted MPP superfamily phosphohydrolase
MPGRYSHPQHWPLPWWVYEIIIWFGLVAAAFGVWFGLASGSLAFTVVSAAIFGLVLYGSFIEPRLIMIRRHEVGRGERQVTIAFLSDLHAGFYKRTGWFRRVVRETNALGADLIILGGDYILASGTDARYLEPLDGLKATLGVYAAIGNHDHYYGYDEVRAALERAHIQALVNASVRLPDRGLAVAAVDDDWYSDAKPAETTAEVGPKDTLILAVHNPEVAVKGLPDVTHRPVLVLSGHDHGGQIRLPFFGSVSAMPHGMGRWLDRGRFVIDGIEFLIGQGVGESGPRARLFCPPEILFVTLKY